MRTYGHTRACGSPPGVVRVLYELKTIRFPRFRVITIMINYNMTMGVTRGTWDRVLENPANKSLKLTINASPPSSLKVKCKQ